MTAVISICQLRGVVKKIGKNWSKMIFGTFENLINKISVRPIFLLDFVFFGPGRLHVMRLNTADDCCYP
jgi:hypothetical protein